jgi:PPOX class probable F420-dependent enzyme
MTIAWSLGSSAVRPCEQIGIGGRSSLAVVLDPDVRRLLAEPNYTHLATLMKDGAPTSIPVWVGLERDKILIGTGRDTLKARNTRRDPRVALSVTDPQNPYKAASIRGRVIEQRPDEDNAVMDQIAIKYTSKPFPLRGPGRIVLVIEPEHVTLRALPFEHKPGRFG